MMVYILIAVSCIGFSVTTAHGAAAIRDRNNRATFECSVASGAWLSAIIIVLIEAVK